MFKMFRYLEKYVGTYRVVAPYDLGTLDFPRDQTGAIIDSFDDLYIPCKRGVIKHTYINNMLCWCCYDSVGTHHNVYNEIKEKYPKLDITYEDCGADGIIYFHEEDLSKIANIVKPKTNGKSIKPFSKKNLPGNVTEYQIPKEDLDKFVELFDSKMEPLQKAQITKKLISEYDLIIPTKKKRIKDVKKAKSESELKPKEFIHSIGLWDDFIKFSKEHYNELKG